MHVFLRNHWLSYAALPDVDGILRVALGPTRYARSTFQRFSGEQPELSLTEFGRFRYLAIVGGERFEFEVGNDIPTRFHPIRG